MAEAAVVPGISETTRKVRLGQVGPGQVKLWLHSLLLGLTWNLTSSTNLLQVESFLTNTVLA